MRVAVVVLAGTETTGDLGRAVNAMTAVKEFKQSGDDVRLIFDGAGTKWIGELAPGNHKYSELFASVKDAISGACDYCAHAFEVHEAINHANVRLLSEFEQHPSFRRLLNDGYQILTF